MDVLLNTRINADGLDLGKARKSTGSLHGTCYSMRKEKGSLSLVSRTAVNQQGLSNIWNYLVFFIVD